MVPGQLPGLGQAPVRLRLGPVDAHHTALVNEARESREELGYTVYKEDQNSFRLRGKYATLAGKPDLIAVKGNDLVIVDAKTDRPNPAHSAQVLIYQYAVPRALPECRGVKFGDHAIYPDSNVQIPASGVDQDGLCDGCDAATTRTGQQG